jgi:2-polyprenyl-6-methoxyphenol hydroxylase-like FAD-dependent oxidoreductase
MSPPADEAASTAVVSASGVVGADGIHSALRKQLHPRDGAPLYSGVTMWRGVVRAPSFLTGGSMVRAGWLASGKMVIYPLTEPDADGTQLINWVAEVERTRPVDREWSRRGSIEDFIDVFAGWTFDWLDVPALIAATDTILEYPMVDQDPLPHWGGGRVTLLGDAAHPMVPRGSNGAGQAILDTLALRVALEAEPTVERAFSSYEAERVPATAAVVLTNRTNPPDAILREVYERTGDEPFENIDDVISRDEITSLVQDYRQVTGMRPSA